MNKLYSIKKHNFLAEKLTFIFGSLAISLVIIGLLFSFYIANSTSNTWQDNLKKTKQKQYLVEQIQTVFVEVLQLNKLPTKAEQREFQTKIDQAKTYLASLQAMSQLSPQEGKSLIEIDFALDTVQAGFHKKDLSSSMFSENELRVIESSGQQESFKLLGHINLATQQRSEERQAKLMKIMLWSVICLSALPFVLYSLLRYLILLGRYNATVDYIPGATFDMEKIFASLPEAAFVLDIAGSIIYSNQRACDLTKYTEAQLAPMHFGQLISQTDISLFERKIQESVTESVTEAVVNLVPLQGAPTTVKLKLAALHVNKIPLTLITLSSIENQKKSFERLQSNNAMFEHSEQLNQTGSWRWNLADDELFWSDQVFSIYGYQRKELTISNKILLSLIPVKEREKVSNAMNESVIFGKPYDLTHHIVQKDGTQVLVRQQATIVRDKKNKAVSMIGTICICPQQQASLDYDPIFMSAKDAMIITDEQGIVQQVNSAFIDVTGFSRENVTGNPISQISRGAYFDESIYSKIWRQLRAANHWEGELWNTKANGIVYPTYQYFSRLQTANNEDIQYLCSFCDISEKKHIAELLSNHSIEQQTKLPSRNVLFDRITQAIKRHERDQKSTVVILISLDTQDEPSKALLESVSSRLKKITRSHDSIARFGLYEFILVLEGVSNPEDAYIVSDKVAKSFKSPFVVNKLNCQLDCNIGIAMHPLHSANDVLLLNYADAAMQYAKENPDSNIQVFNEKILKDYNETQHLNNQLQRAIDLKELSVQFQPIMDLTDKAVAIAVAHIRWHHAAYNNTQTYRFIDAAKNGKLREPLHYWLLNNALEQATQWPNHRLASIKLQIKVVKEQLNKPGLANTIKSLLNLYHYAPSRLILEVELSSVNALDEVAIQEIKTLKDLGISFNVSSLDEDKELSKEQLSTLNIDTLTSVKRSLTDTNQGSQYVDESEKLINAIKASNIYPSRQPWIKNACTINIGPINSGAQRTFLVCDSVPNDKLIILAHLLETKSTAANTSGQ